MTIHRFSLNRHLPETHWIREHQHGEHEQLLLYLTGRGVQRVEGERWPVGVASVIWLPRGTRHAFVKHQTRNPLCLAVDLEHSLSTVPRQASLGAAAVSAVKRALIELKAESSQEGSPHTSASILAIVSHCLKALDGTSARQRPTQHWESRMRTLLLQTGVPADVAPHQVAEALGISLDHLNRSLKLESGLTVGQWLSAARLQRAQRALKAHPDRTIQSISDELGFRDPNYFTRWFRQQTGSPPRKWVTLKT